MQLLADTRSGQKLLVCHDTKSCGRYMMVNRETNEYWPAKCGHRGCYRDECRAMYAARTAKRINQDISLNDLRNCFTLTLDPKDWESAEAGWDGIAAVWNRAREAIARQWKKKKRGPFKYVAVLESHESGWPHIHVIHDIFVPVGEEDRRAGEKLLGEIWHQAGGGTYTYANESFDDMSVYLSKGFRMSRYTTKQFVDVCAYVKPRQRVVWRSCKLLKAEKAVSQIEFVRGFKPFGWNGENLLTNAYTDGIVRAKCMIEVRIVKVGFTCKIAKVGNRDYPHLTILRSVDHGKVNRVANPLSALSSEGIDGGKQDVQRPQGQQKGTAQAEAIAQSKAGFKRQNQRLAEGIGFQEYLGFVWDSIFNKGKSDEERTRRAARPWQPILDLFKKYASRK